MMLMVMELRAMHPEQNLDQAQQMDSYLLKMTMVLQSPLNSQRMKL
jgi:hypothetical protein